MRKKKSTRTPVHVPKGKAATRSNAPPPTPEPESGICVGCDAENTTLVTLPRDTNPKEIFPGYVRDKSRACINCAYHAILVQQVRDAMSYKLDICLYQKQCCLVCNSTTGLTPMSAIKGAKEAVSHPIINAQNIDTYLKMPCSLCTCCAYPLQWLYRKVLQPETPPKPSGKLAPKKESIAGPTRSTRKIKIEVPSESSSSSSEEEEEDEEEEEEEREEDIPVRSTRNRVSVRTPNPPKTLASKSVNKSAVALKISQRVQTPARKSTNKEEAKKPTPALRGRPSGKSSERNCKGDVNKEFWSKEPELTPTRTRQRIVPPKRLGDSVEEVPAKKTRVSLRVTEAEKKPIKFVTPAAKKQLAPVKKSLAGPASSKKRLPRPASRSVSPVLQKPSTRRKPELQERVCETCQQIFYSGTELALHELRHTGKYLRLSLDKYEIPEPVQSLERSFLFQDPVILAEPTQFKVQRESQAFDFQMPEMLEEAESVERELDEKQKESLPVVEEGTSQVVENGVGDYGNDDSSAETETLVGNIIDSLEEKAEEILAEKPASEEQEKSSVETSEKTPTKELENPEKNQITNALSFDYFAPSSPKESSKTSLSFDFFGPSDPPGLKTPPPASTTTASLTFDYFDGSEISPSKDCSMFSPPQVDPSTALKPNSDNPPMPLPSDSDNSLTLTPPKDRSRQVDMEKLESAVREAVGDS